MLFVQGQPRTRVWRVQQGRVRVYVTTPDGRESTLYVAGPGILLGEWGTAEGAYGESGVAVTDAQLEELDANDLSRLAERDPRVARLLIQVLAWKLESLIHLFTWVVRGRVAERIARAIADLARSYGHAVDGGIELRVPFTHQEMADLVAATRVSVSKELERWLAEGLLERRGRHYVIRDLKRFGTLLA